MVLYAAPDSASQTILSLTLHQNLHLYKKERKLKEVQPNTICLRLPKIQVHPIHQMQSKYIHPFLTTSGGVGGSFVRFISRFIELTLWKSIPMVEII